jgi:hypothetical protein
MGLRRARSLGQEKTHLQQVATTAALNLVESVRVEYASCTFFSYLSRYMAELEELVERHRAFAMKAQLSRQDDKAARRKLLKKTDRIVGAPPNEQGEQCPL